jgi:hypothetical protein
MSFFKLLTLRSKVANSWRTPLWLSALRSAPAGLDRVAPFGLDAGCVAPSSIPAKSPAIVIPKHCEIKAKA